MLKKDIMVADDTVTTACKSRDTYNCHRTYAVVIASLCFITFAQELVQILRGTCYCGQGRAGSDSHS